MTDQPHTMTVDDVRKRVAEIRARANDPEVAHAREAGLHVDVLAAIAAGAESPRELASLALETCDIDFPRWHA
jgi:hypothetical protein